MTVNSNPVSNGDLLEFPGGSLVTVVATPTGGSSITTFNCPGAVMGNPAVQQTCMFTSTSTFDTVEINFD